jgi:outer membrane protein assembly factor BamB/LysM repeat protein
MVFYFVQRGETLYTIAKRYQTTVHAIVAANRLEDPNAICPGQALIIPKPGEVPSPAPGGIVHLVRPGETVFHLAAKFATRPQDILLANQIAHPEFILPGQQLVIPEKMEAGEDWPMLGRTPGRSGTSPVVLSGQPQEGWQHTPRKLHGIAPSAPVLRYDRVYAGLGDGYVYSFDRHTGRVKWRFSVGGAAAEKPLDGRPLATPAIFDGLVYLGGPDGAMYAVDAHNGRSIWRVPVADGTLSSPAVMGGLVYAGASDGHVYALEAKTGAVVWKAPAEGPIREPVALGDDHVYAVSQGGLLHAFEVQSGELCWRQELIDLLPPVFAELVVLVGGRAYDPKDGNLVWEVAESGGIPVARIDQVIYPEGTVDLFSGLMKRRRAACETAPPTSVRFAVAAGHLLIGVSEEQAVVAYDLESGRLAWTVSTGDVVAQPPAIGPGQLVLTLRNGAIRSLSLMEQPE